MPPQFLARLPHWLTPNLLLQIGAGLALLVIVALVTWGLRRAVAARRATLGQNHWVNRLAIFEKAFYPMLVWLSGQALLVWLGQIGWDTYWLNWGLAFFGYWAIYQTVHEGLYARWPPPTAKVWSEQILRPVIWSLGLLHATGLLDSFLNASFQPSPDLLITVKAVLYGVLIFLVFWALSRTFREFLRQTFLPHAGLPPAISQTVATVASYVVLIIGTLLGLNLIGIDLSTVAVVAGGLSVGIGFGLQALINNFVSGFILLFERTVVPGDVIEVQGEMGVVEEIGLRTTQVRTADNIRHLIPNGTLLGDVVTSYTHTTHKVRLSIMVGVSYNADPHATTAALLEAAQHPKILNDPAPSVQFLDFGASSLDFRLLVWIDEPMALPTISSDLRFSVWNALKARNIEIPFPQRDVHLYANQPIPVINAGPHREI